MSDAIDPQGNDIALVAELVAAYVSNNHVQANELPGLIRTVHTALTGLVGPAGGTGEGAAAEASKPTPAQIRRSITPEHLISFINGRPYKTLRRHLGAHDLTMETYRARYGLPRDYPAVATAYAETRSQLARSLGLGRPRGATPEPAADPASMAEAGSQKKGRSRKSREPAAAE